MFFILSKLLAIFIKPYIWVMLLLVLAYLFRKKGYHKKILKASLIILVLFSNGGIFMKMVSLWEVEGVQIESVEYHDVAVVLGGMAEYNEDLDRLSMRRGGDRIWQAIDLYHQGKVGQILISGDNGFVTDNGLREANQFKAVLVRFGIPSADILVDSLSKNTYENAIETKRVLNAQGGDQSVLLVTSAIHMRRSYACFERQGFEQLTPFTTDHYDGQAFGWDQYIIPDASVLVSWQQLLHEWVGYLMYAMMGYV